MRAKLLILALIILGSPLTDAASSRENRAGLKYQAALGLGQLELASGYGLKLARFIDEKRLVGLDLKVGVQSEEDSERDQRETSIGVNYKHFLGNSFYLNPKIFYLNWSNPREGFPESNLTTLGAGLVLGNQWQWERFTLGFDWLSLNKNLIFFRKEEIHSGWYLRSFYVYLGVSWN